MKTSRVRVLALLLTFLAGATGLQAHPGHDGHELTWDLAHLATYPVATLLLAVTFAAAGLGGWWLLRRGTAARSQSLRRSQPSRGK